MSKAGRKPGYHHTALVRDRIRVSYLVTRLTKHVRGEVELSATQLRAAEILLRKALPDLASVEHTGLPDRGRDVAEYTDAELCALIASRSAGVADEAPGEDDARSLHRVLDS